MRVPIGCARITAEFTSSTVVGLSVGGVLGLHRPRPDDLVTTVPRHRIAPRRIVAGQARRLAERERVVQEQIGDA